MLCINGCSAGTIGQQAATPTPFEQAHDYETVTVAEIGLSFETPSSWQRIESTWAWSPDSAGQPHVAVQWKDIQPPVEIEAAMLPQNAATLDAEAIELSWGNGRRYTVEVYAAATPSSGKETAARVLAVESHVLIAVAMNGSRRVVDLYASARDAEELLTLQPVLQQMCSSSRLASQ
jgi:hypothetical protein